MQAADCQPTDQPVPTGRAPGLTFKLLSDQGGVRAYCLVFAKGDEVLSGLSDFAAAQHLQAGTFTAIGGFDRATTAWYDLAQKSFLLHHVQGPVELVSLVGDVALFHGKPVGVAVEEGHLIEAYTFPTVELFLTAYPTPLDKKADPETALDLIGPTE